MTRGPATAYKYDVAFSFLAKDLGIAQDLADRLDGLATFIYARQKEELLGGDGMDRFSEVFRHQSRLTVILYRQGWGETPWTAFEEAHIKTKALDTRFSSMMVVKLDRSELPTWIPEQHLYASDDSDTRDQMAAVIRARAREKGAVVRKLNATELALQKSREANAQELRQQRARSNKAPGEIQAELETLYSEILRVVSEIRAGEPEFDIAAGAHGDTCVITSSRTSVGIVLMRVGNTLRDRLLRVNQWHGPHLLPSPSNPNPGGRQHLGATHYSPVLSKDNQWVWKWEPNIGESNMVFISFSDNLYPSTALAEQIVNQHVERLFGD